MIVPFFLTLSLCSAQDYYYNSYNGSRPTLSGIASYRSSLTLDWNDAEDRRQRELVAAFETEIVPSRIISSDCIDYERPSPGKIGRLILELLKNLEGDDGNLIPDLIQVLVRSKLLVETAGLESEPDLESLVKTHGMMVGEPHTTFPRLLAAVWMLVTDPVTTKKFGWCPIKKINKFLSTSTPTEVAKHMRNLEMVTSRARFIMEEFIQSVTPIDMYRTSTRRTKSSSVLTNAPNRAYKESRRAYTSDEPEFANNKWQKSRAPHLPLSRERNTKSSNDARKLMYVSRSVCPSICLLIQFILVIVFVLL
ncbi:uncharacterized protein LOC126970859 [Leptidea sinapis]|uniref:Uncharacterized protein n=1 Tax=Leptidea sinapis TaxID=189913 RepID=A0A5E4PRZ4_9NEOP|nr:uncharacterized protein LOC126970859 [Leptidea sinapis]VVC88896.1 unnamed protein product [Leptidea sinapis]